ncbi:MAG: hypothetical protein DWQ05_21150 [Calditrichaeota bacterium]|nr:MAG: hypothetical protein DWQ05_21150 [Calditrichota bacterium]
MFEKFTANLVIDIFPKSKGKRKNNPDQTVDNTENLDPALVEGSKFWGSTGRFDKLSDRFIRFFNSLDRA